MLVDRRGRGEARDPALRGAATAADRQLRAQHAAAQDEGDERVEDQPRDRRPRQAGQPPLALSSRI